MTKYDVKRLSDFFLEAAVETYASGKKAESFPELAGAKMFRYAKDELYYRDVYVVNGEWSGGQTLIYVNGAPAWIMQYHGWCKGDDKTVLAHLKRSIYTAYTAKRFNGGRGPARFEENYENGLVYENFPQMPSYRWDFDNFQGRERIWQKPDNLTDLFWHRYQGLFLGDV